MRPGSKKRKRPMLRILVFLCAGAVIAGMAAYFAASAWVQRYLRSDACREMLAREIGAAARARCELDPLSWTGAHVYSARLSLSPFAAAGWERVEADGLQASLDWSGVRRGVWSVPAVSLDWVRILLPAGAEPAKKPASTAAAAVEAEAGEGADAGGASGAPAWLRRWLPTRTEIGGIEVNTFDLKPAAPGAGVALEGLQLKAKPAADKGAWQLRGSGGKLALPGFKELFRLSQASARIDARALTLNDASARWLGDSEVNARGEFPFGGGKGWAFSGRLSNLDLRHVLSEEWNQKVSGVLECDYDVSASPGELVLTKAKFRLRSGVVQGFPVLDRVADFTHTARFRRVVLDEATGLVETRGGRTRITDLVLQSNGLIRLEGEFQTEGRAIAGDFLVGVSPETLRWMPGAQNRVFTEPNGGRVPGFVWTRVRISGTLDSPKEDLSPRLLSAMGKAVLLDVPMEVLGKGADILGRTGGAAVEGGKAVLDGGKGVIKGAGEVLEKGVDAIKGVIPLLPK